MRAQYKTKGGKKVSEKKAEAVIQVKGRLYANIPPAVLTKMQVSEGDKLNIFVEGNKAIMEKVEGKRMEFEGGNTPVGEKE